MVNPIANELRRLRLDFESKASEYTDLGLSVYFVGTEPPTDGREFRRPNHAVMLWQYVGHYEPPEGPHLDPEDVTRFGLRGAQVSAFGLIEGSDTELFRRMAYRAGSLVPRSFVDLISARLMGKWKDVSSNGKLVFATNSDPLAVWLNLVLVYTASFHPTRFQRQTLAADPFAASLTVFDHLLGETSLHTASGESDSVNDSATAEGEASSAKDSSPTSFGEAAFKLMWPSGMGARIVVVCVAGGALIIFAIWNSLPDSVKEGLLGWLR